jgi:hypothetical protein
MWGCTPGEGPGGSEEKGGETGKAISRWRMWFCHPTLRTPKSSFPESNADICRQNWIKYHWYDVHLNRS